MQYSNHYSRKQTPQSEPIPGEEHKMAQNSAGGYTYTLDDFGRLERFLILGSEGGTYYASEKKLTVENAKCVERCLDQDYKRAVDKIVEISQAGRAPKNDPAIFALALAAAHKNLDARSYALQNLSKVVRIGTHLFNFVNEVQHHRGWGRSLRNAVGRWYSMPAKRLAYQAVKYQQRSGWSHRDLLRLAHPDPETEAHQTIFHYITQGKTKDLPNVNDVPEDLQLIWAVETAKTTGDVNELIKLITDYKLPHECVPNEYKKDPKVWEALLQDMPMGAMVRNLGRMSSIGLVVPGSDAAILINQRLHDQEHIQRSRLHPLALLSAQCVYNQGRGVKGSLSWTPVNIVSDGLEDAFYLAFKNVEPTNQPTLIAMDVSGSMNWEGIAGMPGLSPCKASAALALVTARTESNYQIMGFAHTFKDLGITARDTLNSAMQKAQSMNFGGTDCALPMIWALQNKLTFHNFIVLTDCETWAGAIQPSRALREYRSRMSSPGKLAVVGMTSSGFTLADPNDSGMCDFVGLDTTTPAVMADFFRN